MCVTDCMTTHPQTGKSTHKLLIIGTTGFDNDTLSQTGLITAFDNIIPVPYLSNGSEVLAVLQESNMYHFSNDEVTALQARLKGRR